jgi:2,4-dienoyl-CoA reductase (NADPH2)
VVQVIGDALVPRRVAHAIAEGRAAAEAILARARLLAARA